MEKDDQNIQNNESALILAEEFIKKYYLEDLSTFKVTLPRRSVWEANIEKTSRLFKLNEVVFNKQENALDKLNNVYGAMHGLGLSLIFLLVSNGRSVDFYLGAKLKPGKTDEEISDKMGEAFEKTFYGNFPGSELEAVPASGANALLKKILPESGQNTVTALTSIPALKDLDAQNVQYTQGIEKLIDTMQGKEYAILIISDPVDHNQLAWTKQGYEELYTELSPLAGTETSVGKSDAESISTSELEGYTKTIGTSVAKTQSYSKGISSSNSESRTRTLGMSMGVFGSGNSSSSVSDGRETSKSGNIGGGIGIVNVGLSMAAAVTKTLTRSMGIAGGGNVGGHVDVAKTKGSTVGEQENKQWGEQRGQHEDEARSKQRGEQQGTTKTDSSTTTVRITNKSVDVLLKTIDEHLERIKACENYGMWSSAAYFIAPEKEDTVIAASAYKGIINGEGTSLENSSMSTWFRDDNTKRINQYLRLFNHPQFNAPDYLINTDAPTGVLPTTMVNTKELAIQCNIPYKSVPGVPVREMAEFGRNIYSTSKDAQRKIKIGNIYHMGREEKGSPVDLDVERFREHTFVTGSTGSGKSNTIYSIIPQLWERYKIPTLVIEPAKGEYKQVFGDTFHVFGTNPAYTELLRINPFKFDAKIHVLEHIDRLIDIFNVCWPMYAAMPAVLKEAVELAYIRAGWNLDTSQNKVDPDLYPCFKDVLSALREVISHSDYSQEVKDNYTGSLITRVKSLTNGLNGRIFVSNEIDSHVLFEENTIIDLSRVGSSETKAMIMGIMIMRLQEYRMAQGGINLPMKHLTVLEEAHNILKRTSTEQISESANLLGKSVEMIANAIAEMRTYGEGFMIADQAPALLDLSVIRNTNTKIILHLPDEADRELVGKSAGLKDEQIADLAKLTTGVAAIYQNRWIEPVLCQVCYYDVKPKEYIAPKEPPTPVNDYLLRDEILQHVLSKVAKEQPDRDVESLKSRLTNSTLPAAVRAKLYTFLQKERPESLDAVYNEVAACYEELPTALKIAFKAKDIDQWNEIMLNNLNFEMETMSRICRENILECIVRATAEQENPEHYQKWIEHMGRGSVV